MVPKVREIQAKSILVKTGFPLDDFVVNPYSGCAFACAYCFAEFLRRFQGHTKEEWGSYVDVKVNAPQLLEKELDRLILRIKKGNIHFKNGKYPIVSMSSVTDPYQPLEAKYMLTRECLEIFIKKNFPGEVSILTKSPLVTRDIDLFKKLKRVSVGLTITNTDDPVSRIVERNAPRAEFRLKALKKLNDGGINTYVCVNPVLPHLAGNAKLLEKLLRSIKDTGTDEVFIEHLNLSYGKRQRLSKLIKGKVSTEIFEKYWLSQGEDYKRELEQKLSEIVKKLKLKVAGGSIIDHGKFMKKD